MPVSPTASESLAVMEAARDNETEVDESESGSSSEATQGLRAHFRRTRILGGSVLVAGGILVALAVLHGDGVRIATFATDDKSDQERKQLLDYYNSVSGSISSLVAKPIELFLGLFVSVAFLSFAADVALGRGTDGHWQQHLPLAAAAALAYLFGNGLNAVNVQITSGELSPSIAAEDLAFAQVSLNDQPLFENGSLRTAWDRSYAENASSNPVLNTILRTSLFAPEHVSSRCAFKRDVNQLPLPTVTFGFPSRTWHTEALPTVLEPEAALKMTMGEPDPSASLPPNVTLPMSTATASNLVIYGIHVLIGLNLGISGSYELRANSFSSKPKPPRVANFYNLSTSSEAPSPSTTRTFLRESNALWQRLFNDTGNLTLDSTTVEYSRTNVSDRLVYDALTLELPVTTMSRYLLKDNFTGADAFYSLDALSSCSRDGCTLYAPLVNERVGVISVPTRVQVAGICVDAAGSEDMTIFDNPGEDEFVSPCDHVSNTSMLIVSVGKRVEGELWDQVGSSLSARVRLKNPRTVYSITVGRLAWETEDLARAFGATCRAGDCMGLRHQLRSDASEYLVVGTRSLPLAMLSRYNIGDVATTKWRSLVALQDSGADTPEVVVLLPRRFSAITTNGSSLRTRNRTECVSNLDDFVLAVEKNHLYMEQSFQTSYTAAFYFLFQNAVHHTRMNATATLGSSPPLAFAGNVQMLNVQVSVPTANAVVSLVGCVLLLVLSVSVVVRAKQSEEELHQRSSADVVAEAIMSSSKFPPSLLALALEKPTTTALNGSSSAETQRVNVAVQDLRVKSVVLCSAARGEQSKLTEFHIGSEQ